MSIGGADLSSKFALDVQGVNQLKLDARQSSPEALKAAARQFEAVFMNMLMKSMREATPQDGMFDSEQTRMYTSLLDQQLTQNLASRGIGLADVMVRQLSTALAAQPSSEAATPAGARLDAGLALNPTGAAPLQQRAAPGERGDVPAHVQSFVQRMAGHAEAASAGSGIPPRFMLGQAALETGWGRNEIRGADGQNSHNLFGIKAGRGWAGRSVDVVTTEYVNGRPQKQVERFRAYDSYADSFRDYARLLRSNARYADVMARGQDAAGFAQGLQQAGYATDPAYAGKLMGVIRLLETA
jgi:flagellar protein FlgJ